MVAQRTLDAFQHRNLAEGMGKALPPSSRASTAIRGPGRQRGAEVEERSDVSVQQHAGPQHWNNV